MATTWKKVDDGEYNEHQATINGRQVTVYSDCEGERWSMVVDNGEPQDLEANDILPALKEATRELRNWT